MFYINTPIRKRNLARPRIISGYHWESIVFGFSSKQLPEPKYLDWSSALKNAISLQEKLGWDPVNPRTMLASELLKCVRSYLHPETAPNLKFYCSLGTALDHFHGIDCFFKVQGFTVLIDLTLANKPIRSDVLLFKPKDATQNMWQFGKKIADMFNSEFIKARYIKRNQKHCA